MPNKSCKCSYSIKLTPALQRLRFAVGSGLCTSWTDEYDWELARRLLVPAFRPLNLQSMFGQMNDIVSQCLLKWARFAPESSIYVSADWTRLTLDTLALCTMGYRFDSFYSEQFHPFVAAFTRPLELAGARATRSPLMSIFRIAEETEYLKVINYQRDLCKGLIQ
jgi:cytochrome P450/NADPH-cytochrome P450 reductase